MCVLLNRRWPQDDRRARSWISSHLWNYVQPNSPMYRIALWYDCDFRLGSHIATHLVVTVSLSRMFWMCEAIHIPKGGGKTSTAADDNHLGVCGASHMDRTPCPMCLGKHIRNKWPSSYMRSVVPSWLALLVFKKRYGFYLASVRYQSAASPIFVFDQTSQ